ncbi:MAG: CBS domain-containing protein [Rhodospirillales bacterium]|jgi:CBS domain-containing protein|nr:CBS domain-containing protein [Rhodospirillaceae bacterium]MDP6427899.1 CBS domain-containing protein [Rhodospirillales bacterium]MDP6644406.1 CBS domain-containing protein [Rhodospirillales bacterium]MDP6841728.1 CBS domain-containing protein [Rhodospirillales bacterium]|tara:strand:+ start:1210 stop:1659 length:450 start_codon:yes stop_codon:yes gene_type:complete
MTGKIVPDIVDKQTLYTLPPDSTCRDAAKMMDANKISAVLVVTDERLQGIITERDLTAKVLAGGLDPDATRLESIMTPNPDVLAPDDPPQDALELMRIRGYRHLPVLDEGNIVGMVSIRDLYAAAKEQLEEDVRQRESFIFDTGYGTGA